MLPSLIFGGLTSSGEDGAEQPVLNDGAAVVENINTVAFSVNQILGEGIDDAIARIADHFSTTEGDNYEIINPYEEEITHNLNLFLGQYCAVKEQDWQTISAEDMEAILRSGLSHLYSFTYTTEEREVEDDDPDTLGIETKIELWYIYTIVYNGEEYFADKIFALNDEQKVLSAQYAGNMSLFLKDRMFQSVPNGSGYSIPSLGSVTFSDGSTSVVYYNQMDERYSSKPYGTDDIGGYGCGPTSMAMVVSSLTSDSMDPIEMSKWAYENGYWCKLSSSYHGLIPGAAKHWGLNVEGCPPSEPQRIVDALSCGKLVVALMGPGHFTRSGHFIVLRGLQDGKILVADPASYERCQKTWDLAVILSEASQMAGAGGPLWIVG